MTNPAFGDRIRGIWAGEKNPQRDGMYVRTVRRTGRCNPGTFYELTDGKGRFWQYEAADTLRHADFASDAAIDQASEALMQERWTRKFGARATPGTEGSEGG